MNQDLKSSSSVDNTNKMTCEDLNLQIPCEIVSRVHQYAQANKTSLTNVVIEALDAFLRINKD
ncbi:MAG: hypothetical protein RBT11_08395 [Desulfobacterales bacterium]|jgi:hypothetical protein|nr:hypothetical protein [Desulfobacterales bacterium]